MSPRKEMEVAWHVYVLALELHRASFIICFWSRDSHKVLPRFKGIRGGAQTPTLDGRNVKVTL